MLASTNTKSTQKMKSPLLYENRIFHSWATAKVEAYRLLYPNEFAENPNKPPRKGFAKGEAYPLSLSKYEAATLCVLYGLDLKSRRNADDPRRYRLSNILGIMSCPPSEQLLRVWRTQERFKTLVEELIEEFADYIAHNIVKGGEEGLPGESSRFFSKGLERKFKFVNEAFYYPPELVRSINRKIASRFEPGAQRVIWDYLGHHVWCYNLLYHCTERPKQRWLYQEICGDVIGRHWPDRFFEDYRSENEWRTSEKGLNVPPPLSTSINDKLMYLAQGDFWDLQRLFGEELAFILKVEITRIATNNDLSGLDDIKSGLDFLAGRYKMKIEGEGEYTALKDRERMKREVEFVKNYKAKYGEFKIKE